RRPPPGRPRPVPRRRLRRDRAPPPPPAPLRRPRGRAARPRRRHPPRPPAGACGGAGRRPRGPRPVLAARRGRRGEAWEVLVGDPGAFAPFWGLDEAGLAEALTATSSVHFQVARTAAGIVGYAVCGRAGPRGYGA